MRPLDDNMDMCYLSLISGRSSISALKFLTHCSMCIQNLKSHLRHCHFYPFLWFIGIREETVQYIYTMIIMQQYHGFYSFLCLIRTILNAIQHCSYSVKILLLSRIVEVALNFIKDYLLMSKSFQCNQFEYPDCQSVKIIAAQFWRVILGNRES